MIEWKRGREGHVGILVSHSSGTLSALENLSGDDDGLPSCGRDGRVKNVLRSFKERDRPMDVETSRRMRSSAPVASSSSVSFQNIASRLEQSIPWGLRRAI